MVSPSSLRSARILLVEDNEINRQLALELLDEEGANVAVATNGREALELLDKQSFDCVLMDCRMPVMDGFEAVKALRQRPGLRDLPVIAMTGEAAPEDREKALAAGMNDHIAKPIDIDLVISTVQRWISRRPAPDGAA